MSSDTQTPWLSRRLAGAGAGAVAALLLVDLELALRWLPALRETGLQGLGTLPLAAGILALLIGVAGGLVHRGAAYLALIAAAVAGAADPVIAGALAVVAAAVAERLRRHPPLAFLCAGPLVAAVFALRPPAPSPGPTQGPPDIVLVVLDTVSAPATSLHGSALDTTPALAALAAQATTYTQATSPAPWTVPAHASMLTGLLPRESGCHHEHAALPPGPTTTAEALTAAGYRTGAFLANPWVGDFNGLTRGFQTVENQWHHTTATRAFSLLGLIPARPAKGGGGMRDAALRFLDADDTAPAFVLLNLLEAHSPFHETPQATRFGVDDPVVVSERTHLVQEAGLGAVPDYPQPGEIDQARKLYAAGIRHVDDLVGELVAALQARGRWDRTVLAVTSDHGEAFGEHGFHGHMIGLHQETLHVPLVVRVPDRAPTQIDAPTSTAQLHPTLLSLAGLPPPTGQQVLPTDPAAPTGTVLSEQMRPLQVISDQRRAGQAGELGDLDHRAVRVRDARWAVLGQAPTDGGATRWQLYDLQADPTEALDRWSDRAGLPQVEAARIDALANTARDRLAQPVNNDAAPAMDVDLRAELEALGYLGGD